MLKRLIEIILGGTSDYQYAILESTPLLHPAHQLQTMLNNANNDYQKSAILNHIVRFEDITMQFNDYRCIYDKIYDEYLK